MKDQIDFTIPFSYYAFEQKNAPLRQTQKLTKIGMHHYPVKTILGQSEQPCIRKKTTSQYE